MTFAELEVAVSETYKGVPGLCLLCPVCGRTYSATPGDYWASTGPTVPECHGEPLQLAQYVPETFKRLPLKPHRTGGRSCTP